MTEFLSTYLVPVRALIVLVILITAALLIPVPHTGRLGGCLLDMLHVPVFAILGAVVYRMVGDRSKLPKAMVMLVCWALVCVFGLVTETLQMFVGRVGSWHDLWANLCGSLAGILWVSSLGETRWGRGGCLIVSGGLMFLMGTADQILRLTDVVIQRQEIPMLATFESRLELYRWHFNDCRATRIQRYATDRQWSLQVDLQQGVYPGVALVEPFPDWSGYQELVIDVLLSDIRPLDITVKIQDADHNDDYDDRFNRLIRLLPGENEIVVQLAEVASAPRGRQMDMQRIAGLSLFTNSPRQPRTLYLDNIRLR